jgi:hypothetical protein
VQAVFDPIRTTCTGQIRRVEQIHWDSITRLLLKAKANPHAVTKKRRQSSASSSAFSTPPQKKAKITKPIAKPIVKSSKVKAKIAKPIAKSSKAKAEQTSSKDADNNESDDEVECISPPPNAKKGKSAFRVSKKNQEFEVAGPDPTDEDCGRILLDQGDTNCLGRQGQMLTGCTTTAYLNLLVHKYHASKVRRSDDQFVSRFEYFLAAEGRKAGWNEYLTELCLQESGSKAIDWETDKLIVLQIFRGPVEAGHWASLIIDRTRPNQSLAVFADSLPTYSRNSFRDLQEILQHTPLSNNVTWIFAKTPVQGCGTNDCGVCAYTFPTLYVRALEKQGLLSTVDKDRNRQLAPKIQAVELLLPSTMNMFTFGAAARKHMKSSLRHGVLDSKSPILDCEVVWT